MAGFDDAMLASAAALNNTLQIAANAVNGSKQYNRQKKLMREQNWYNVENWKMQNEYNLPINQVARLSEAGLNPALFYGSGSQSNVGGAISPVSGQQGHGDPYSRVSTLEAMQGMAALRNMDAQTRKTEQETENLTQYNRIQAQDEKLRSLQVIAQGLANSKTEDEADVWRSLLDARIYTMEQQGLNTWANTENIDSIRRFREKTQDERFDLAMRLNRAQLNLLYDRRGEIAASIARDLASAGYSRQLANKVDYDIQNVIQGIKESKSRVSLNDISNEIDNVLLERGINLRSSNIIDRIIRWDFNVDYNARKNGYIK